MKQVIFIAGTAYSGSTMLDMMIGNSNVSFSLGEVKFLFEPTRKHHINPACDCGDRDCNIWNELKSYGKYKFYSEIFKKFKKIDVIVDSSKDLFWINEQRKNLASVGIGSKVVLIWKRPEEFALSRYKRNDLKGWHKAWMRYHRIYLSTIENGYSLEYKKLATDPSHSLQRLCSVLSIPYFEKMEHYWNKKHHTLFGNLSTKYHTSIRGDHKYKTIFDNINRVERRIDDQKNNIEKKHRQIYYKSEFNKILPKQVLEMSKSQAFETILYAIQSRNIFDTNNNIPEFNYKKIIYSKLLIDLYSIKSTLKTKIFNIKNKCYPN